MSKLTTGIILALLVLITGLQTSCNRELDPSDFRIELTELQTGSESSIRALHVVDKNVIWAGGSGGQYMLSANGGSSWKLGIVTGAENDDLRSIHAWGATSAQLFGTSNPGRGYITDTAGEDWHIVFEDTTSGVFFNSLKYADEFRGLALSDPLDSVSYIIKTVDGGQSWERVVKLPVLLDGESNFAASNTCIEYLRSGHIWIVSGGGASRVFSSDDHGETWKVSESGLAHNVPSSGIFSVSFLDELRGIIVGGTYDQPELNQRIAAFTLDGGEKWILSEIMPAQYRSCAFWLKYRGKDIAVSVGKTGIDISTDYGNSWLNVSEEGFYTGRPVQGTLTGFLAGSEGRISKMELKFRKRDSKKNYTEEDIINTENE